MPKTVCYLLVLPMLWGTVRAHHAFSADYEIGVTGTIEGVITDVFFQNPHVHYFVEVLTEDGTRETWDAQTYNLTIMRRSGWTEDTLKAGERVKIFGNLGRNNTRLIAIQWVEKEDGTVMHFGFGPPRRSDSE